MTTQPFVRPGDPVPPPETGGGKISCEPPIVAPIPPPRSVWAIVLPVTLVFGVRRADRRHVRLRHALAGRRVRHLRVHGGVRRGRHGAAQPRARAEDVVGRADGAAPKWFARQDEIRDEVDAQRRQQWEHRRHFHWDPAELADVAGSVRMWDRAPGSDVFAVVRVGVGKVALAMTMEKPKIAQATHLEPATGHALRKFLNEQEYIDDMPKAIWLQRFPGISFVGDLDEGRGVGAGDALPAGRVPQPRRPADHRRHFGADQWDWAKWLPHVQHGSRRDGCGERRLLFSSPAELEAFLDEDPDGPGQPWTPAVERAARAAPPARRCRCGSSSTTTAAPRRTGPGLTGAAAMRARASSGWPPRYRRGRRCGVRGARYLGGVRPVTTYRLADGRAAQAAATADRYRDSRAAPVRPGRAESDELDDAFYATADQMSVADAERFARALARYRAKDSPA